jgi:hypothetical protein
MNNEKSFFQKSLKEKKPKTSSSERDFFEYAMNDSLAPSKGSVADLLEQTKQIPMQAVGSIGSLAKGLVRGAQMIGAGQESSYPQPGESLYEQPDISEKLPLPTAENIGTSLGYEEPTTRTGRFGKAIFSNVGSALPAIVATTIGAPAATLPAIASTALGGAVGQSARELGAPESLATAADIASTLGAGYGLSKNIVKPSGLTSRRFEELEKRRKISPSQFETIKYGIENEAKDLSERLFSKSPTYQELKEHPAKFYEKLDIGFDRVKNLSKNIPITTNGQNLKDSLLKKISEKKLPPITMGEHGKSYSDQMEKIYDGIEKDGKFGLDDIIEQYRFNNKELKGYFDASKSGAANEGKKDALLDYNRALSDEIHKKVPNSSLDNLFKDTNKRFSDAMNVNKAESFISDIFKDNKIDYLKVKDYFKNKDLKRSLSQTFGKDTESKFSQLLKDILSQEKGMSKLRPSESQKLHLYKPATVKNYALGLLMNLPQKQGQIGTKMKIPGIAVPGIAVPGISGKGIQEANKRSKHETTIEDVLANI